MPDNYKSLIIKELAKAPTANLEKITNAAITLCKRMPDNLKYLIIQALATFC